MSPNHGLSFVSDHDMSVINQAHGLINLENKPNHIIIE
jgi:hypothetical protein